MMDRFRLLLLLVALLPAAACNGRSPGPAPTIADQSTTAPPAATAAPTLIIQSDLAPTARPTATRPAAVLATRVGADYVLLLPRESAVPADWAMHPGPDFETRRPRPGELYRFGCLDLPARSVGLATIGYRHLEGLPSVFIEYVIYPTAAQAEDALQDMRRAVDECATFTIGEGDGATTAAFSPLDAPAAGDSAFAALLDTSSAATGELQIHMAKVRSGHVVIGLSHTAFADGALADESLIESLLALSVENLRGGPAEPGE